jgi:hypothetical protein
VNLGQLNAPVRRSAPPKTASAMPGSHRGGNVTPVFKVLFDLLLHNRPGISPLTFDNYHNVILVDYLPTDSMRFSFEFNPGNPRYYELEVKTSPSLSLRLGRIAIPFDDMNPHNLYGGFVGTSKMVDQGNPDTAQFLPDIFADLGVGLRYKWIDDVNMNATSDLYVVNGFQSSGTDPTGSGVLYPNFGSIPALDNNDDKAVGFRTHFWWQNTIGFGFSGYQCRYTPSSDASKRLFLVGVDGQLRFPLTRSTLKAGYLYGRVNLPDSSPQDHYLRGGMYADYEQKIYGGWFLGGRFGMLNSDDRIEDVNDVTMVGARFGYAADFWSGTLQFFHDLKAVPGKRNREYGALRLVVML